MLKDMPFGLIITTMGIFLMPANWFGLKQLLPILLTVELLQYLLAPLKRQQE